MHRCKLVNTLVNVFKVISSSAYKRRQDKRNAQRKHINGIKTEFKKPLNVCYLNRIFIFISIKAASNEYV